MAVADTAENVEVDTDSLMALPDSVIKPVVQVDRKVVLENEKVRLLIDTRGEHCFRAA